MNDNTIEIIINASDRATKTIEGVLGRIQSGFGNVGKKLMGAGAALSLAVAPIAGALGVAVSTAVQFNESMTNVQAVLGATGDEMSVIEDQILAIGEASRFGPQAAAEAFYDIVGGVADATTHTAILEAAIKTAEAGAADLGGTTSALISIMNSYGFSADEAAFASDVLTQTVGAGVGSMEEFAAAMPQVTGLASSLGIGFDNLGAAMAYMTTKGFSASQSATQLRGMMVALLNPNEKMKTALEEAGFASGEAAIQQLGLVGAFQSLMDKSPTFQSGMAGAIGSVEALNGVIALTDEGFAGFAETFVTSVEGATDAAQQIQMSSPAAQMDLLKSSVEALKIEIGSALLPVLNDALSAVKPIISQVVDWAKQNPELIGQVGKLAAVLGAAGAVLTVVGAAIAFITSPIGVVIVAMAALYAAWQTNFLGIRDIVQGIVDFFMQWRDQFEAIFGAIVARLQAGDLAGALDEIGNLFNFLFDEVIPAAIERFGPAVGELFVKLWELQLKLMEWIVTELIPELIARAPGVVKALLKFVVDAIRDISPKLGEFRNTIINYISGTLIPNVLDKARSIGSAIINGVKNGISNGWDAFKKWLMDKFDVDLVGGLKGLLGISSPSKVFEGIGQNILAGFAQGLNNLSILENASANMVGATTQAPTVGAVGGTNGGGITIQAVYINANSYAEGRQAARGFEDEMRSKYRASGNTGVAT